MGVILIIAAVIFIITYIIKLIKNNSSEDYDKYSNNKEKTSYSKYPPLLSEQYKKRFLLTINEKNQYIKLKSYTDKHNLWLFSKVRMGDIVAPINNDYTLLNRVNRKHIDFVILAPSGYTLAAIEIDDSSHNSEKAKYNDTIKNEILESVGIPLFRYYAVNEERLEQDITPLI